MEIISGLQEGQVLQRRKSSVAEVVLRGVCATDGPVRVSLSKNGKSLQGWNRRHVGKAVAGRFAVRLREIPAGGPYKLRLKAGNAETVIRQFFVGDVWILAGQSNMEGAGKLPGLSQAHPLVRAFSLAREWRLADDPLHVHAESPDACHNYGHKISPEQADAWRRSARTGAGVGVPFGCENVEAYRYAAGSDLHCTRG